MAGGYAAGLILQKAIEQAGSVDKAAVLKALDAIRRRHGAGAIQLGRGLGIRP